MPGQSGGGTHALVLKTSSLLRFLRGPEGVSSLAVPLQQEELCFANRSGSAHNTRSQNSDGVYVLAQRAFKEKSKCNFTTFLHLSRGRCGKIRLTFARQTSKARPRGSQGKETTMRRPWLCVSLLAIAFATGANGQSSLTTIWSFDGTNGDGPSGPLVFDSSGAIYGTTEIGGTSNSGTVFQLTPLAGSGSWTYSVIHTFRRHGRGDACVNPSVRCQWHPVCNHMDRWYGVVLPGPRHSVQACPVVEGQLLDRDGAYELAEQRAKPQCFRGGP